MKNYLVLILLLLTGCAGTRTRQQFLLESKKPIVLSLDSNLDQKTRTTIQKVAADTNHRLGWQAIQVKSSGQFTVLYDNDLKMNQLGRTSCKNGRCFIALSYRFKSNYKTSASVFFGFDNRLSSKALANTLRHEISHGFGMDHSEQENQIMSEQSNPEELNESQVSQWAKDLNQYILTQNGQE